MPFAQIKDEVCCERSGDVKLRGIAYPIATYRVLGLHENMAPGRGVIRAELPNVKIEVDVAAITDDEREKAIDLLQDALKDLSSPCLQKI